MRVCTMCLKQYDHTARTDIFSPFYCTEECRTSGSPCVSCGRPTQDARSRFCSDECLRIKHPPPYTCETCNDQFSPTGPTNRNVPPRYCRPECFENRLSVGADALMRPAERRYVQALKVAPTELPVMKNGAPYRQVRSKYLKPFKDLDIRTQNAILFWRFLVNTDISCDKTLFLSYVACHGIAPDHQIGIPRANTYWPYIRQDVPNSGLVRQHQESFWEVRSMNIAGAEPETLLKSLERAHRIRLDGAMTKPEIRFKHEYMDKRDDLGGKTRLFLMCQRYVTFSADPPDETWLNDSKETLDAIHFEFMKLHTWYLAQTNKKKQAWSPDPMTAALKALPMKDSRMTTMIEQELYR